MSELRLSLSAVKKIVIKLLREYRQLFVKNGFDLSYEQVVLNQPEKSEIKATKKTIKEAEEFAKEQKEASQKLEEQQS